MFVFVLFMTLYSLRSAIKCLRMTAIFFLPQEILQQPYIKESPYSTGYISYHPSPLLSMGGQSDVTGL